jgi:hypothetical protein
METIGAPHSSNWDGVWYVKSHLGNDGWTAEIAIPFKTLKFPHAPVQTWGINFQRTVRRKNEDSIWMGWARNQGLDRMTNAGHVKGISKVTQGKGLDVKPYGLVSAESAPIAGSPGWDGSKNAGVDVFWMFTLMMSLGLLVVFLMKGCGIYAFVYANAITALPRRANSGPSKQKLARMRRTNSMSAVIGVGSTVFRCRPLSS